MKKADKDFYQVTLLIAIAMIVGLVWLHVDRKNEDSYAPCSREYVSEYGAQDCEEYQKRLDQQDYRDCGFKPTC
jgi:hypothetical protein